MTTTRTPHRPAVCRFKEQVDKLFREFRLRNPDINWDRAARADLLARFAEFITTEVEDAARVDVA